MSYIQSYDHLLAEYLEDGMNKEDAEVLAAENAYDHAIDQAASLLDLVDTSA